MDDLTLIFEEQRNPPARRPRRVLAVGARVRRPIDRPGRASQTCRPSVGRTLVGLAGRADV